MDHWLKPGRAHDWGDARVLGKEPGQPVLFLRPGSPHPRWVGWGRILEPEERWWVFGVRTSCIRAFDPPLEAVDPALEARHRGRPENDWENRALGAALGLLDFRDKTPYREVGATDFQLTISDLRHLVRVQPRLRGLIESPSRGGARRSLGSG